MEIVFIRHFPTKGNRKGQYIGSKDEDLDMKAVQEIMNQIGDLHKVYPSADIVVASPMKRCVQTSRILYSDHEIVICHEMRECDFGLFEGKNYEELKDDPDYQSWMESGGEKPFPKGESRMDFQKRCVDGMEETMTMLLDKNYTRAAFVVHGGTIMSVFSAFDKEKRDFYHWQVKNGQGYTARIDEDAWKHGEKYFSEIKKLCFI